MADKENGAAAPNGNASSPGDRELVIKAQYLKDLSFENPRAPQILLQQTAPEVAISIDVRAGALGQDNYEVVLSVEAQAKAGDAVAFIVQLSYGAVIGLRNVPQEAMGLALLVEAPRLMFPFARAIIANATREGGFPPLMLHPVDFAELARRQKQTPQPGDGGTAFA
ncbi:MAG TPA: protein-export chaperone SecB [Stellaceae bacterium]|nr:protein-export chaperone SecB [Stellaceae bacterium]